ncbi:helix-turn-helix transcriptional regulator [Burkholderia ubonensis]|uniref:helix-turn-helix transcriptional regulator n=1 Tax=Burkholderia ubonensis TaxID=101571 RepID=UPI0018DF1C69|nr:AlpA family phage regulatory protein [Burkholderia ubonensis]
MNALRMKQVSVKLCLGQSTLYRMIAVGTFPKPFELVPGRTAWLESDIDAWLQERAQCDGVMEHSQYSERRIRSRRESEAQASDRENIDELALRIAMRLTPHALWDLAEVAEYLHRSEQHTRQWIIPQDGFPRPIRIPSGKGAERPRPLWRSKDVIAWAESFIEM